MDYFGKGKGQPKYPISEMPVFPKESYGFDKERLYTKDHIKHRNDMGFKDSDKYNKAAMDFWNNGKGTFYYSERRGNFAKIAPDQVTVCLCDKDGRIQSYYKYPNIASAENFKLLERLIEI